VLIRTYASNQILVLTFPSFSVLNVISGLIELVPEVFLLFVAFYAKEQGVVF
jgi:hypothetical protein